MGDDYKCTLDEKLLKKAEEELNEDEKNRLGAVETFRQWVTTQTHLKCPTDTSFLLRYLRVGKFSQLAAREFLTNQLKLAQDRPEYFANIDMTETKIQNFLSTGYFMFPDKKDSLGRQVGIFRPAMLDPEFKNYDKKALYQAAIGTFNYFLALEECQVTGFVYLMDLTGFSMAQSKVWGLDDMKLNGRMFNKCFPGRFKAIHYYNHGPIFEGLFEIFKTFLSKKMKDRITFHGSNMESVYKVIPKECLPLEYLPDDYDGPNAGTIPELIVDLKKKLSQPDFLARLKRETDPSVASIDLNAVRDAGIPQESFRRLNVD